MGLLKFIKKIRKRFCVDIIENDPKYMYFKDSVIPSLKFGDIIYAERFNNDIEKESMGEGHTSGPFIVLSFDGDKVVCAYCTSNSYAKGSFQIGEDYNLFYRAKNTYATLFKLKTIDSEAYLSKHEKSLSEMDINRIKKKLCLTSSIYTYDDFGLEKDLNINFDVQFEVGDVVRYEKQCYIIIDKKDNDNYLLIPIANYDYCYSFIDFSESKIDYTVSKEAKKNKMFYRNSIPNSQMIFVMKQYKDYIKMKNKPLVDDKKKLDRGCLLQADDGLYYVFGITGNTANSFYVRCVNIGDRAISIAGKKYMPNYGRTRDFDINGKGYAILKIATEEEMDAIKASRKNYKKVKKESNSNSKSINSKNNVGNVFVCLIDNETSRYMIYTENNNSYCVITVSSLLSGGNLEITELPKYMVKRTDNITTNELRTIKNNLLRANSSKLSKKLLNKLH